MQKQTFSIEKLNAVSVKRILRKTYQAKFKAIRSFKFAKKINKKRSPPPSLPTKKVPRLRILKKHADSAPQTPLFVHHWLPLRNFSTQIFLF